MGELKTNECLSSKMESTNTNGKVQNSDDTDASEKSAKENLSKSDLNLNLDKSKNRTTDKYTNVFLLICIAGALLGIVSEVINSIQRNQKSTADIENFKGRHKYWVYSATKDVQNRNGLLKHVHLVLERLGYEKSSNDTPWDLLWSHDYPFRALYPNMHKLKPRQKVNHFPGTGHITNKVDFATTDSKYIPKAFKLPKDKKDFLKYAKENKNSLFLEKHNQHRGVFLKNVSEIDVSSGESFVQEYIQNPFLVDGHKFDIGVYVVVTSVNPLRVYWYKGDVLFRYCPAKYKPFDPKNLDKYVVADDYLPTWEVPSLAHPYTALGFSMKHAFDIYARSKGKDPARMWAEVREAIAEVFRKKEHYIVEALKQYPSAENFFEMMRVDLIIDEEFRVYLLEANMSPNLSSSHYPPNQLLYEQVLYNLFSLTGVSQAFMDGNQSDKTSAEEMIATQKNIAVFGSECSTICRESCETSEVCKLCRPCLDGKLRSSLLNAQREFLHNGDFRRLVPPPMTSGQEMTSLEQKLKGLSPMNRLQHLWFQGKCNDDITWCS